MSTIGKLLKGLEKKYKVYSFLSPITMVGEVVLETAIPLMMARIIDVGIANGNLPYVIKTGLIMVAMSVVSLAFGALGARFASVAAFGFSRNLRRNLFARVQEFSFGNADRFSTSSLVTRLTTDVTNVQNTYQMLIRICVRAPFILVSGTVMACILSRRLSMIFFIVIPVLALLLTLIARTAFPRFGIMLKQYDLLNATVQENLIGIRVVKSFVRRVFETEKFQNAADSVRKAQVNAEKIVILNLPLMQIVVYSCIIVSLWFGGRLIVAGHLLTGELVSFITYITQILMALMMLSMVFINIIISRASIVRVCEILDEVPEIRNPEPVTFTAMDGNSVTGSFNKVQNGCIDFKNVSFSYHKDRDNCVLTDINLHIDCGMVVGIIGGTGSSKTTLVSLIPRLYDVLSGCVMVGGVDVRKYDLVPLRNSVAMVLQNNILFSGTIRENLKWGCDEARDEEIRQACIAADADEFVSALSDGYDTVLGQGGVNLSGGQKQRLCIARALLKKPKVLILDDSTSAVDTATDARIRKALRENLRDTTKIIIAQRINSVKDADIIFVMDNGRIVGSGTHKELLKSNDIYREVYESQQSEG